MLKKIEFEAIGYVKRTDNKAHVPWDDFDTVSQIIINPELEESLIGLKEYSHIVVLFYFHKRKKMQLTIHPEGNENYPKVGILSTRSPKRPNPIGTTIVKLVDVKNNIITVAGLDALDETPIIDIKPFLGIEEAVKSYHIPAWLENLWLERNNN